MLLNCNFNYAWHLWNCSKRISPQSRFVSSLQCTIPHSSQCRHTQGWLQLFVAVFGLSTLIGQDLWGEWVKSGCWKCHLPPQPHLHSVVITDATLTRDFGIYRFASNSVFFQGSIVCIVFCLKVHVKYNVTWGLGETAVLRRRCTIQSMVHSAMVFNLIKMPQWMIHILCPLSSSSWVLCYWSCI